jgi:bacterioferritin-associated ferredoxin
MYICLCNAITERQIRACAAESGARSLCDLESCLGVGTNCGRCRPAANEILADLGSEPTLALSGAPA